MKRRAFTLVELLAVIAILVVLAALLFPVFARSKERAKLTACQGRLRQFALALNLYRNDHDTLGYLWAHGDHTGNRYPFNNFAGMASYLGSGDTVWCPEPNSDPAEISARNFYSKKSWLEILPNDPQHTRVYHSFAPEPGQVLTFCGNHASNEPDPRPFEGSHLRKGKYPFIREDLSAGIAENSQMELWYCGADGCIHELTKPGVANGVSTLRFPGEPWQPTLER